MSLPERLGSVAEILLSEPPVLVLAVAALCTVCAPFADRYVIRRKRLHYRVQYNSKIGLSPVNLHDDRDSVRPADTQLLPIAELLDRMSIVVVRIRNSGVEDIDSGDFDSPPEFTFGGRVIWNARISEPSVESHRKRLKESLEFFPLDRPGERRVPSPRSYEPSRRSTRTPVGRPHVSTPRPPAAFAGSGSSRASATTEPTTAKPTRTNGPSSPRCRTAGRAWPRPISRPIRSRWSYTRWW